MGAQVHGLGTKFNDPTYTPLVTPEGGIEMEARGTGKGAGGIYNYV